MPIYHIQDTNTFQLPVVIPDFLFRTKPKVTIKRNIYSR